MSSEDGPRFLTDAEAAAMLGRTVSTVRRMRSQRRIAFLPGQPPLIERCDVVAVLEERKRKAQLARRGLPISALTPEEREERKRENAHRRWFMHRLRKGWYDHKR